MKLFKVQFDCTISTVAAHSYDDAVAVLMEYSPLFYKDSDGYLKFRWCDGLEALVNIEESNFERGVIQWEAH